MKANNHTAHTRNARPLPYPGAYVEDCGQYVRLIIFKGAIVDWFQRCNDTAHALRIAKERARGRV